MEDNKTSGIVLRISPFSNFSQGEKSFLYKVELFGHIRFSTFAKSAKDAAAFSWLFMDALSDIESNFLKIKECAV